MLFGMTAIPCCAKCRSKIWAGDFEWARAISSTTGSWRTAGIVGALRWSHTLMNSFTLFLYSNLNLRKASFGIIFNPSLRTKSSKCAHGNIVLWANLPQPFLLKESVQLHLQIIRLDLSWLNNFLNLLAVKVGQTDGFCSTSIHLIFHCLNVAYNKCSLGVASRSLN